MGVGLNCRFSNPERAPYSPLPEALFSTFYWIGRIAIFCTIIPSSKSCWRIAFEEILEHLNDQVPHSNADLVLPKPKSATCKPRRCGTKCKLFNNSKQDPPAQQRLNPLFTKTNQWTAYAL